jgi:subtilisin-like proprotein convertase family protein
VRVQRGARAARPGQGLDSKGERMIKKRSARMALLACASVASLGLLAGPTSAAAKKAKTVTKTAAFNQCVNAAAPIVDANVDTGATSATSAAVPVTVPNFKKKPQDGVVTAITSAGVRITHTFADDLVLLLVSPGGKATMLVNNQGGVGDGYGSGAASCSGSLVQFGDAFSTSILDPGNTGDDPIVGNFRPEQPLSPLAGGPARGNWTLVVVDELTGDTGAINAVSLNITYQYKALKKKKKKK